MNAFTLEHVILWEKGTNTYDEHDVESVKAFMWLRRYKVVSYPPHLNLVCIKLISLKIGIFSQSTIL